MAVKSITKSKKSDKSLETKLLEIDQNDLLLAKYIRVFLANQRQSNAHTKTRGEVRGGGAKPWRQKGTGRARHGSIRSPIWKGGGVVFGPSNETNYKLKINKKEKVIAFVTVLKKRLEEESIFVTKILDESKKTKDAVEFLEKNKLTDSSLTVVTDNADVRKMFENIDNVIVKNSADFSVFDFARTINIVFDEEAFDKIIKVKENVFFK
jgi:large subunit ribosomal protein L4